MGDVNRLAGQLGVPTARLAMLERYDDAAIARLEQALAGATVAEDRAFDKALDEALRFIPRLLRGTAQKLLFPGGRRG